MSEETTRSDEQKAQMYQAMLDGANVITSVLDADNEYGNDLTNAEKQAKVLRSSGYLEHGVALTDWGSEDFTVINAAISAANAYDPDA
jgi:hypothetical protein